VTGRRQLAGPAAKRVQHLGDTAVRVAVPEDSGAAGPGALADEIRARAWVGVEDVVAGYESVTVICEPDVGDLDGLGAELAVIEARDPDAREVATVEIPVVFDGPDLAEVAALIAGTEHDVVELMTGSPLDVAMVGFVPGFGYLTGLPAPLSDVGRRATPRSRLPAGSVAIAGGYAGVYPVASPGGWRLLGRTGLVLFDRETPPFAVLRPGDRVRFRAVAEAAAIVELPRSLLRAGASSRAVMLDPGALATIQDSGRVGVAALGVPRAGVADRHSAALANLAVGNEVAAAVLEITQPGVSLRVDASTCVALAGDAPLLIDGSPVPSSAVHPVSPGQVVSIGPLVSGARAYLAMAGGLEVPAVFGSRSSDLLCGIGVGPLRPGDELGVGPARGRARGRIEQPVHQTTLRVLPGPDGRDELVWRALLRASFDVSTASDRTGVRLTPDRSVGAPPAVEGSKAMVTGAVQLPPDGCPIVLGVDHATLGGYPVVAVVAECDHPRLGQLRPGDEVHFEQIDRAEASRLRARAKAELGRLVSGWYPVRAG